MSGRQLNRAQVSEGIVYEKPAVMPDDPAEVAGRVAERRFVMERRHRGVGWFNLANMTGRTVHDLRRDYDLGYRPC